MNKINMLGKEAFNVLSYMKNRLSLITCFSLVRLMVLEQLYVVKYNHGRIAKHLAGNPDPSFNFGNVATINAPVAGTLSRFVINSI